MPMLTDLATAARKSGLKVVEEKGWKTRGHGALAKVESIVIHHTAGPLKGNAPSLKVVTAGRTGLKGPLSQLFLGRDGTVHVVAAGVAYHAGATFHPRQDNWHAIGIEAENAGTAKDPWSKVQYDACVRLVAALVKHYKVPVANVQGHREVAKPAGRKVDPAYTGVFESMDQFRKDVAKVVDDDGFLDVEFATFNAGYASTKPGLAPYLERVDGIAAKAAESGADVIGFQETGSGKYLAALDEAMGKHDYVRVPKGGRWRHIYIRLGRGITVHKSGLVRIDKLGGKHMAWTELSKGKARFMVGDLHAVVTPTKPVLSAAKTKARKEKYEGKRRYQVRKAERKLAARKTYAAQPVILLGDFNSNDAYRQLSDRYKRLTPNGGIDHILASRGNTRKRTTATIQTAGVTDHPLKSATAGIKEQS